MKSKQLLIAINIINQEGLGTNPKSQARETNDQNMSNSAKDLSKNKNKNQGIFPVQVPGQGDKWKNDQSMSNSAQTCLI